MPNKFFPIKTDTACQLKWNWSTIRFYNGLTSSCHRAGFDQIDLSNFDQFHNSPTKNHVNFKALIKYFNVNLNRHINLDDVTDILKKHKLLNKTNLDILMPLAIEVVNENSMDNFIIKSVEPSEDVYKSLEENILDGQLDTQIYDDNDEKLNLNFNL